MTHHPTTIVTLTRAIPNVNGQDQPYMYCRTFELTVGGADDDQYVMDYLMRAFDGLEKDHGIVHEMVPDPR